MATDCLMLRPPVGNLTMRAVWLLLWVASADDMVLEGRRWQKRNAKILAALRNLAPAIEEDVCSGTTTTTIGTKTTPLKYLHFPKTGTTFLSTIFRYACDARRAVPKSSFVGLFGPSVS